MQWLEDRSILLNGKKAIILFASKQIRAINWLDGTNFNDFFLFRFYNVTNSNFQGTLHCCVSEAVVCSLAGKWAEILWIVFVEASEPADNNELLFSSSVVICYFDLLYAIGNILMLLFLFLPPLLLPLLQNILEFCQFMPTYVVILLVPLPHHHLSVLPTLPIWKFDRCWKLPFREIWHFFSKIFQITKSFTTFSNDIG